MTFHLFKLRLQHLEKVYFQELDENNNRQDLEDDHSQAITAEFCRKVTRLYRQVEREAPYADPIANGTLTFAYKRLPVFYVGRPNPDHPHRGCWGIFFLIWRKNELTYRKQTKAERLEYLKKRYKVALAPQ